MVRRAWRPTLFAAWAAAGLVACASAVDDPALYAAGWRPAFVVGRGAAESLISAEVGLCIGDQVWQPGQPAAAVSFRSENRYQPRRVTIVVPTSGSEPVDDRVWVNVLSCRLRKGPPASVDE